MGLERDILGGVLGQVKGDGYCGCFGGPRLLGA